VQCDTADDALTEGLGLKSTEQQELFTE